MTPGLLPITARRRVGVALVWMIGGSSMVMALLLIMNTYISSPEPAQALAPATFNVERDKPQPPPRPKPRRERPRDSSRRVAAPAAPQLSGSLSGMSFGIPAFDVRDITAMDESVLGSARDIVMTEDSVDSPPRARQRSQVDYPRRARERGITGYVTMNLLINADGEVERVNVLESEPAGVFDDAAVASVSAWRFDPATYKGIPVKLWAKQTLRFDLK